MVVLYFLAIAAVDVLWKIEIPAFAGMSCLGMGVVGGFGDICIYDTVRFLPTQEWSRWERGCVGEYGDICIYDTVRFLLSQEWSAGEADNCG